MSIAAIVKLFPFTRVLAAVPVMVLAVAVAMPVAAQTPKNASLRSAPGIAQAPTVGVIDVAKAIDQYPVYIKLRTAVDARFATFQEQLKGQVKQLQELQVSIQAMGESVPERAEAEHQYKMGLQTQDFRRKYFNDLLATEELRMMLEVYEDLDFAVAKVAQKSGVTLVLPKRDIPRSPMPIADMQQREVQGRVSAFQSRTVWFAAKEVDITGDVIKYMMTPLPARTSPERAPAMPRPAGNGGGNGNDLNKKD
ncbi:MAG: Skp family chaperone for outer membrane protein [Hyphomicrobiaceae bacterium]|jgi:Skp family chaperone for outer membrane proteins